MLDLFGAMTSLSATLLFITVNRNAWLITLVATLLNGYLYAQKGIYADMLLEVAFFASAFYGWFNWRNTATHKPVEITNLSSPRHWLTLLSTLVLLYSFLTWFLSTYTHSNVASLDAITSTLCLIAQWLTCRKIIISWILWLLTDLIYAYLYYIKDLPFHSSLAIFYTILAVVGYLNWQKIQKSHKKPLSFGLNTIISPPLKQF